jgi:(p)ppGpp synthase/HD superfamily hydrolase
VASIVAEVSDDRSLPKEMRKALQVKMAPKKSDGAKLVKLADKISNLRAIMVAPPASWDHARRVEYVGWAGRVAAGLRGVNPSLEALFDTTYREAMAALAREAA